MSVLFPVAKKLFVLPLALCALASPQFTWAQTAPNLIGTWVGETNDAVIGGGTHYPDGKSGEIRFLKSVVTYKFDQQKIVHFQAPSILQGIQ